MGGKYAVSVSRQVQKWQAEVAGAPFAKNSSCHGCAEGSSVKGKRVNRQPELGGGTPNHHHTPEAEVVVTKAGCAVVAEGRRELVAIISVKGTAAQHKGGAIGVVKVLAPLQDISGKIVNAKVVRSERAYRACVGKSITITEVEAIHETGIP